MPEPDAALPRRPAPHAASVGPGNVLLRPGGDGGEGAGPRVRVSRACGRPGADRPRGRAGTAAGGLGPQGSVMVDTFKKLIANQFEAALCTLNTCIDRCPESSWN